MTKEIRRQILLTQGAETVEKLKANLPPAWQCHPRTKSDADFLVTCVALVGDGDSEKELLRSLFEALGNADFEWEEVKEESATR